MSVERNSRGVTWNMKVHGSNKDEIEQKFESYLKVVEKAVNKVKLMEELQND